MRLSDISRRLAVLCFLLAWSGHDSSAAEHRVRVVVSFSILGDIAQQIGGSDVAVTSLIGPDSDAHVFEPSPDQARVLASAQLFIVNGLGLEGWETRLVQSAQYRGPVVVASDGVTPIEANEPGTATPAPDPHAWQDVKNAEVYAANIARALEGVDPAHGEAYRGRFDRYRAQLEALDRQVRAELSAIPALKRRVITTHDAFAYYGKTYGVTFLAPEGLSTDSEPSAEAIAKLIRQIRREGIKALFLENISDPRLMEALARETGATLGPLLFSDALSRSDEPASSYTKMVEYNTAALKEGMLKN
ncbi:MAG TPA: zinc ABC transporter substrate-binding protein [Stellaceae bacterium]|nr:zinc ABC transporter substrate-binding protein [Stellaceae bacterium]